MYGEAFGTDWDSIADPEEVVSRAFALGVATRFEESHPGELDRLRDQIDSSYDRSMVKLAFQQGRSLAAGVDTEDVETVWAKLAEETVYLDPPPDRASGESGSADGFDETIPEALGRPDVDKQAPSSTDVLARPTFLDRVPDRPRSRAATGARSPFGRPIDRGSRDRSDRDAGDTAPDEPDQDRRPTTPDRPSGGQRSDTPKDDPVADTLDEPTESARGDDESGADAGAQNDE